MAVVGAGVFPKTFSEEKSVWVASVDGGPRSVVGLEREVERGRGGGRRNGGWGRRGGVRRGRGEVRMVSVRRRVRRSWGLGGCIFVAGCGWRVVLDVLVLL